MDRELALVEPDGTTIAYELSPEYPQQLSNISYGAATTGEARVEPMPHVSQGAPRAPSLRWVVWLVLFAILSNT